jgi:hypothetical protein
VVREMVNADVAPTKVMSRTCLELDTNIGVIVDSYIITASDFI